MITLPNITGEKYAVLGLGKSGLATAAALGASGANVVVWDDNQASRDEAEKAGYALGNPAEINLYGFKALVLAPGIPLTHPAPHPAVLRCKTAKVPVIGDIELLFRACPKATFVGVTGTNGKSTTTALIAHILKSAGRTMQVGGNLGTPVLALEPLEADGAYVLELSSYQLDLMQSNLLGVAVLLNVTPDHLDRHGDMAGYIKAKERIARADAPQTLVLGVDEAETQGVAERLSARQNLKIVEISVARRLEKGIFLSESALSCSDDGEPPRVLVPLSALPALPGAHNAQNAAAAFAACLALGLTAERIRAGLRSFPGLAHRQQLVATLRGVRFINDSKATNANATSKALACYDNIYWIIGGRPKAGGLNGLEPFMPRIRQAFLIGESTEDFAAWCDGKCAFTRCGTLEKAVERAALTAWQEKQKGSVVLLSPACASFDQFPNFEVRGETFISLVQHLKPV